MIDPLELRLGNYVLYKAGVRILKTTLSFQHFESLGKGLTKEFFPIALKPDILQKAGFIENKEYAFLPEAREFHLTLPVIGNNKNEIIAYINNHQECYARATVNDLVICNNFHYLHQLQNLYYLLTGSELKLFI